MAKILAVATHGTDDPTRSSLAFITALGALAAGKDVEIALLAEAVYLANPALAKSVHGVGLPPLSELIEKVVQENVPVYVLKGCAAARGVTTEDLKSLNAAFIDRTKFAELVSEASVVSF